MNALTLPELDQSKPMMWTTHGNMNVDALEHFIEWQKNGDAVVFIQVAKYNGEEVRRDTYVHMIEGLSSLAEQATL